MKTRFGIILAITIAAALLGYWLTTLYTSRSAPPAAEERNIIEPRRIPLH